MNTKTIAVVVAGTGFDGRASIIRSHCKDGIPVQLYRDKNNEFDKNAISVWIHCSSFFGLFKSWKMIGFIPAKRAASWAPKIDSGEISFGTAFVRSFYAADSEIHPRVSLAIEVSSE